MKRTIGETREFNFIGDPPRGHIYVWDSIKEKGVLVEVTNVYNVKSIDHKRKVVICTLLKIIKR
jgi:hypothetical protein